jgi:hypothetical protein
MNLEFNKNEDAMKLALAQINKHLEKIAQGGGKNRWKGSAKRISLQQGSE